MSRLTIKGLTVNRLQVFAIARGVDITCVEELDLQHRQVEPTFGMGDDTFDIEGGAAISRAHGVPETVAEVADVAVMDDRADPLTLQRDDRSFVERKLFNPVEEVLILGGVAGDVAWQPSGNAGKEVRSGRENPLIAAFAGG